MDELNLLRQHQHQHQHHLVVRGLGEEIDLEIGPGDDPSFPGAALVGVTPGAHDPADDHKSLLIPCSQPVAEGQPQPTPPQVEEHDGLLRLPGQTKKKKKVVKKWREEWADTYKWAYVAVHDNTSRIFCTVCKEYGRKHRRNPYGNEGSRNMQMSALEEHNNSLLHKEALRLQTASKENAQPPEIERPVYVKDMSKFWSVCWNLRDALSSECHGLMIETLKNALSQYKLGGAAGGSDFDPKGKSESEIMRFCQSFMDELYRYLGPDQDFPAEDVGVGPREMGYLFGQYRRLSGHFQGNFTGPKIFWSGSSFRTEATGYGLVFFARVVLADMNKELKGLRCVISGSGKIAMHVLEKLLSCEAIPVTVSDSKGYLLDTEGFDYMKYSVLRNIKAQQRSLKEYLKSYPNAKYIDDAKPWSEKCDVAFPCASQNEIDQAEALAIINSGCRVLIECSNMPCTAQAVDILRTAKVVVAPAKATAAGGVAVGELELNPEFSLMQWSVEDFENKIQDAVKQTYDRSIKAAQDYGIMKENPESLVHGANICAFLNIAQAMTDQGCV
ncbi:hypothetical protein OsI_02416 [Oryza sativa Indica Group]|uniref:glutamate dehydrogenase (NADP(+)) n=1 Tax=Oryza sativa subsp. indica TaxID=39946 RepID=B8AA37_ORYSI|nr:hypothetical protein OsI_02416 [Oryza sativa Indica Group]